MATNIQNRVPTYPGRVTLTPVTGQPNTYDLVRADSPTQAGTPINKALLDEIGVHTLTHAKTGTVHALTGLNGAAGILSCQFKATAAFAAGNTLKVDGTSYTIKLTNGEDAEDNLFVAGAIVSCIVDTSGKTVNFKAGGGGYKKDDVIAPENLERVYESTFNYYSQDYLNVLDATYYTFYANPQNTALYFIRPGYGLIMSPFGELIASPTKSVGNEYGTIAFDDTGNFYGCNTGDNSVVKYNMDGTSEIVLTGASSAVLIWVAPYLYVLYDGTMKKLSADGTLIETLTINGSGSFFGGCSDSDGNIYYGYSTYIAKISASGTKIWSSSVSPISSCKKFANLGGYIYYVNEDGDTVKRISTDGVKDSTWSVTVPSGNIKRLNTVQINGTDYLAYDARYYMVLIDVNSKTELLNMGGDSKVAYSFSNNGALYRADLNSSKQVFNLHPKITGYKVKEVAK